MKLISGKKTFRFVAAAFLADFAGGLFNVSMPFLAMSLGADSIHLGILGGLWTITYAFACPLSGFMCDRFSRRKMIVISVLCQCAIMFLIANSGALWHLYPLAFFWALFLSMFWPSLFGWLGDSHHASELGRATGVVNLGWSVGKMMGGLAGGIIFLFHSSLPFLAGMVPLAIVCILMGSEKDKSLSHALEEKDSMAVITSKRKLVGAWMGAFAICCLAGLLFIVFPKYGNDELGIDAAMFGKLVFIAGLMRSIIFLSGFRFGEVLRDWRCDVMMLTITALMVGSIFFYASLTWVWLVYMALGIGLGISYYRGLYTSLESANSRGLKSAMHEGMLRVGDMVGSFGGGVLILVIGDIRAPYLPIAGLALFLGFVQWSILRGSATNQCPAAASFGRVGYPE